MKTVLALLLISAASSAYAEGAPAVNENTGDLGYVYAFDLPKARGRYQPTLALVYSSANNRDLGYGHGWTLTSTYLERDVRTVPGKETLWLVEGAKRTLLVATSGSVFRPEVEDAFLEVTAVDPYSSSRPVYAARDANDTRFTFDRPHGSRVYLTRVEDLDGNVVSFRFARGTDASLEDPVEVAYNLRPGTTSGFATVVRLDYGTGLDTTGAPVPAPSAPVAAGGPVFSEIGDVIDSFVRRTSRLNRVRILGAVGDPRERSIRGYDIRYTPASTAAGGYSSIAEITQLGLDLAPSRALPSTRFDYLGAASFGTAVEGAATLQPAPDPCWGFALVDVDADGRPDLRCSAEGELRWVRNVTPIGSDTLAFAPTASVVPLPAPPEGTGGWGLDDFNGDGVLDLVRWFRTSE